MSDQPTLWDAIRPQIGFGSDIAGYHQSSAGTRSGMPRPMCVGGEPREGSWAKKKLHIRLYDASGLLVHDFNFWTGMDITTDRDVRVVQDYTFERGIAYGELLVEVEADETAADEIEPDADQGFAREQAFKMSIETYNHLVSTAAVVEMTVDEFNDQAQAEPEPGMSPAHLNALMATDCASSSTPRGELRSQVCWAPLMRRRVGSAWLLRLHPVYRRLWVRVPPATPWASLGP